LSLVNRFGSFDFISVYLVTMKRIGLQWLWKGSTNGFGCEFDYEN
jgi:hypothetical protein